MAPLDLDALEAIISAIRPQCTHCREFSTLETVRPGACEYDEELSLVQALAALCLTSKQLATLVTHHLLPPPHMQAVGPPRPHPDRAPGHRNPCAAPREQPLGLLASQGVVGSPPGAHARRHGLLA